MVEWHLSADLTRIADQVVPAVQVVLVLKQVRLFLYLHSLPDQLESDRRTMELGLSVLHLLLIRLLVLHLLLLLHLLVMHLLVLRLLPHLAECRSAVVLLLPLLPSN